MYGVLGFAAWPRGSMYPIIMELGPKRRSLSLSWFRGSGFHSGSIYGASGLEYSML